MEMETEGLEQNQEREHGRIVEATPQEPALTVESMEEEVLQQGTNIERATNTTVEVVLQEPTSTLEPL